MWAKPIRGTLPNKLHPLTPTAAWIMNEGSGYKIFDSISNIISDAFTGSPLPIWVPEGIFVNQGTGKIPISDTDSFKGIGIGNYSIVGMVKLPTDLPIYAGFFTFDTYNPAWMFNYNRMDIYDGGFIGAGTKDMNDNIKHQVAWVRKGIGANQTKYYVDGAIDATFNHSASMVNPSKVYLLHNQSTSESLDGICYFIYFYNYALSASQISQLYVNPYCWFAQPEDLASLYVSLGQEYTESVIMELQSKYNQLSIEEYQLLKILKDKYNQSDTFNLEKIKKKINQSEMRKRHS